MNRAETRTGRDSARGVECERGFLEGYDIVAVLNGHHGRKQTRALRNPSPDRRGRHGRGVQGLRHTAEPDSQTERSPIGICLTEVTADQGDGAINERALPS